MRAGLSTWRGGQGPDQRRGWRNNHSLLSISPRREEVDLEGQREAERASDGAGTAAVAAGVAVEGGAKPVSTGIGWVTILSVFLTQVSFVGFLFRLSTPAIRELKERRRGRARLKLQLELSQYFAHARYNSISSPLATRIPRAELDRRFKLLNGRGNAMEPVFFAT